MLFKISALGLFLKYPKKREDFRLNIPIKFILVEKIA